MTRSAHLLPGVPLIESPLFPASLDEAQLSDEERNTAEQLHERGFALIDFPDVEIDERIARIKAALAPSFDVDFSRPESVETSGNLRIQDAWKDNADVRALAVNDRVLSLLSRLYGRRAFPFQTLNFPVGTEQHVHSDSVHFSCIPERFMCGVWLAMEDVHADAGPLLYYPGSHKWPILTNEMLGRRVDGDRSISAQAPYEPVWRAMLERAGIEAETFLPRKGQALIWSANLLHGGAPRNDPTRTRWSQVTHYYFEDCVYYTPAFSEATLGRLDHRAITNAATGNLVTQTYLGKEVSPPRKPSSPISNLLKLLPRRAQKHPDLPTDFNAESYYRLNPDIAEAGTDAARHYLAHGRKEQRRYR